MRDFSWKYFSLTGDVEAFMLYKESQGCSVLDTEWSAADSQPDEENADEDSALS